VTIPNPVEKVRGGLLRPNAAVAERCPFNEAEKAIYPVLGMCTMLSVSRSSFYAWRSRSEILTGLRRRRLADRVADVFDASRGTCGCRRVAAELNRQGRRAASGWSRT